MPLLFRTPSWIVPVSACFLTGVVVSLLWEHVDRGAELQLSAQAAAPGTSAEVTSPSGPEAMVESGPLPEQSSTNLFEIAAPGAERFTSLQPAPQACVSTATTAATPPTLLNQFLTQITRTEPVFNSLVNTFGLVVNLHLTSQPFPQIHERSRLARVPVLMYHDVLPEKKVFFDLTPEELERHFQLIQEHGLTPITLDQLVSHLSTGLPLPPKPVLLSFDDGYEGHYTHVLPLLREYGYPAVFGIYTKKVGTRMGRSSLTWEQLQEMAADPLVTIASHSVTHKVLTELTDEQLRREIFDSKRILEEKLGIPINHFVYPKGKYDDRARALLQQAGYHSALIMRNGEDKFASESEDLMTIERLGQSRIELAIAQSYGGPPASMAIFGDRFDFSTPVQKQQLELNDTRLVLVSGGRPITIHADSRYQVPEIIANTNAVAAVDGGFFSLRSLDSNVMIGPVLSQKTGRFDPSNRSENPRLNGRPLVLIAPRSVRFVPFNASRHQTLEGLRNELPDVTDAFVAAAWLVKGGEARSPESFGNLYGFDVPRHRAFWGINQAGQPMIGISQTRVDSVELGELLRQAGLREAVMLDSGASTSLAYRGKLMVEGYEPRPVPHVVALLPPGEAANFNCIPPASSGETEAGETLEN